ncbi:TetR/AcrR family transcriptional regulator [Rhodococcus pseudokoreensis]|uniref:TetR/AcrR family transcriptional regulator n=1 Tax=Rhodococcus pseudokoreensis TaxID=2811421 RepID=A0A974ZWV2_9NOCA|nr:TetR/AcrR family transcriptional regulator [Rhodococcus pseudokoreensis]QSE93426.1 TetR/AcrR family transcriptional regulator [Rhodococcus pseudokoreensis]
MAARTGNDPATDVRSTILSAAESCFERFGITKTTMEDVARAADMSRATVYRYFSDRESLIIESVARRARKNMTPARAFIAKWPTIEERLVEGICQNVESGLRDPMVHLLVSPSEMTLANSLLTTSGKAVELTSELWEPILSEAQEAGDLRADLDLTLLCEWISELEIMCISQLNGGTGSLERFREKIRTFLVPSVVPAALPAGD